MRPAWRPARPMRFAHLTTFYPPYAFGGDGVYVQRLAHALADEGHEVDVIHCTDSYRLFHRGPPAPAEPDHPQVRRHALESALGPLSPILTHVTGRPWLKRRRLSEVLAARPFDVVQFHNASLLGPGAFGLAAAGDPLRIYTAHEHWLICPMHVLYKFGAGPCDTPQCVRCSLRGGRPPQLWRSTSLLERESRHIDAFFAPTGAVIDMHRARGFASPMQHLPYFVDRSDADWQTPRPRPHARPYCLFVGRLEKVKGLQDVIPVWPRVAGLDLLVAGDGGWVGPLRAMATDPRIHFLGQRSQSELGALYAHAFATIVPAVTHEAFGLAIIESLARKTPVLVRALGAVEEVARTSGGALLWRKPSELVEVIERLQQEPVLRGQLGEAGYDTCMRLWTREAHLEQYFSALGALAMAKYGRVPWAEPADA